MKIMVTGAEGMLGRAVVRELARLGIACVGTDRESLDLTDAEGVQRRVAAERPDGIIHCAGYTAVDRAETEPEVCMAVNAVGTQHLARAAADAGASLLLVSTDYVFDGEGSAPWDVLSPRRPLNVYGLSKLQAEEAVRGLMVRFFIVRTSWLFAPWGHNFVRTVLSAGREHRHLSVVCDQVGSPTYAPDLAAFLCALIRTDRYGIYHATNEGFCSWADLAQAAFDLSGLACTVQPVPSAARPAAARRPLNSRLSKDCLDRAGFPRLPAWDDALRRCLAEMEG